MNLSQNFVVTGSSPVIETNFFYPVRLSDGYELALTSFLCGPLCNVGSENDVLYLSHDGDQILIEIPHAHYHTVGELLTVIKVAINNYFKGGSKMCSLTYGVRNNVWTLTLPHKFSITTCRAEAKNVMNLFFLENGDYTVIEIQESVFTPELQIVFLYASIVQESFIDNRQSRLLAIIPVIKNETYVAYEPTNLLYHEIAIDNFSTITFELRNQEGELIEIAKPRSCDDLTAELKQLPLILTLSLRKAINT